MKYTILIFIVLIFVSGCITTENEKSLQNTSPIFTPSPTPFDDYDVMTNSGSGVVVTTNNVTWNGKYWMVGIDENGTPYVPNITTAKFESTNKGIFIDNETSNHMRVMAILASNASKEANDTVDCRREPMFSKKCP